MFASAYVGDRDGRTRISHYATLDRPACAAFVKESRMEFVNAARLNGKSGAALPSVLLILDLKTFEKDTYSAHVR